MIQEWIRHSVESKPRSGVAVLVDGENISQDLAGQIINRASALGPLVVKRVYGNAAKMPKWEAAPGFRLAHSGAGKNATDLLLAIEAVSLFHEGSIDTVVIASSDRDFSHLAHHLRERQITVVGMGEAKAPEAFRKACSKFLELGIEKPSAPIANPKRKPPTAILPKVREAMKENARSDGWCTVTWLGKALRRVDPEFDPKNYVGTGLTDVLTKTGAMEIWEIEGEQTLVRISPVKS